MDTNESCKLPYCKECSGAYKILFLVFLVIVFYFFFLRGTVSPDEIVHKDFMNLKVFDFALLENCCSLWPLSHFFLFFVLGVLFPDCGFILMTIGVAWEGFEMAISSVQSKNRQAVRDLKRGNIEYSGNWWAGSTKDIVMNALGFSVGWFVAKKLGKKVCIHGLNSETGYCQSED